MPKSECLPGYVIRLNVWISSCRAKELQSREMLFSVAPKIAGMHQISIGNSANLI